MENERLEHLPRKYAGAEFIPGGMRRAVHVFTPSLMHRIKHKEPVPVMAIRCASENYTEMRLYERVTILGPSSVEPIFDTPLPGTGGRGVAIMFTEAPIYAEWDLPPRPIDTSGDQKPEAILEDVLKELRVHVQGGRSFSVPTVGVPMNPFLQGLLDVLKAGVSALENLANNGQAQAPVAAQPLIPPQAAQIGPVPVPMPYFLGQRVNLNGNRRGVGSVVAIARDGRNIQANNDKGREMIQSRGHLPFPQLAVKVEDPTRRRAIVVHYHGNDLAQGKVAEARAY